MPEDRVSEHSEDGVAYTLTAYVRKYEKMELWPWVTRTFLFIS